MPETSQRIAAWADRIEAEWESSMHDPPLKRIAYFCGYVPEEMLSASGACAWRMKARNDISTEIADTYLGVFNCSYTRAMLETILDPDAPQADGYVFTSSCDHLRRLYDNLIYAASPPFCHILDLPRKMHADALEWYVRELNHLRDKLRAHFGVPMTDGDIRAAIAESNQTRGLIRKLNDLRQKDRPPLTGADMQRIVNLCLSLPKAFINPKLEALIDELEGVEIPGAYRARIVLAGSQVDDPEYIRAIEQVGALVVADDYCSGAHHYTDPVAENGDPVEALAARYLNKTPCPRMFDNYPARLQHLMDTASTWRADGIVIQAMKFCDCWGIEAGVLSRNLKEMNLPALLLEREYAMGGSGQIMTRVQAFIESMGF